MKRGWLAGWVVVWLVALGGCSARPEPEIALRIEPVEGGPPGEVRVILSATDPGFWKQTRPGSWEKALTLRARTRMDGLLGRFEVVGHELHFTPSLPLLPGDYEAEFRPQPLGLKQTVSLKMDYQVKADAVPQVPVLSAIYPSSGVLPANHLKFYLQFSEPMLQGEMLRHLKLLNAAGAEVPEPFRETELWSADGRRLTVWFHPGRQKTGVNLNVELGPVLEPEQNYRLVISGNWPSLAGVPLGKDHSKAFRTQAPDHTQPQLNRWEWSTPVAGTRAPLEIKFPEPLDWALLQQELRMEDLKGRELPGTRAVSAEETRWSFTPLTPWKAGRYRLEVSAILEDLAGNNLHRPFEVDLERPAPVKTGPVVYQEFEIGPPGP